LRLQRDESRLLVFAEEDWKSDMGCLYYGAQGMYKFDDRTLSHLRTVIASKLLRHESFVFTWNEGESQRTIWLHPSLALDFTFDGNDDLAVNRAWIEALSSLANGPAGLHLVSEPTEAG
jgi:hypothetical protein